ALVAGTVIRKQERRGRSDQQYAFVSLSDPTGMFEVMVFSEVLAASRQLMEAGKSVLMAVAVDWTDDELKLRALSCNDLEKAAADAGEGLRIFLENEFPLNGIATHLNRPGKGIVTIVVQQARGARSRSSCPNSFRSPPRTETRSNRCPASLPSKPSRERRPPRQDAATLPPAIWGPVQNRCAHAHPTPHRPPAQTPNPVPRRPSRHEPVRSRIRDCFSAPRFAGSRKTPLLAGSSECDS